MENQNSVEPPGHLRKTYRDWDWSLVWNHIPQVATWRLQHPGGRVLYLKVARESWYPPVLDEAERNAWASQYVPAPQVVSSGNESGVDWQLTIALPGAPAIDPALLAEPARLVPVLAAGLRQVHSMPVERCPFDYRIDTALAHVRRRAAEGEIQPAKDFHAVHQHLDVRAALAELERLRPPSEDLVVCHGDYCLPNVLIESWKPAGFVDLGEMGVADRWRDLAVSTWSVTWNLGEGFEGLFLQSYGIEPDPERQAFYRLLHDMSS